PAEALQPPGPAAREVELGEVERRRVADQDLAHLARAIDQHADAAPELVRHLGELAHDLRRRGDVGRQPPPVQGLERLDLARLETARLAVDPLQPDLADGIVGAERRAVKIGSETKAERRLVGLRSEGLPARFDRANAGTRASDARAGPPCRSSTSV